MTKSSPLAPRHSSFVIRHSSFVIHLPPSPLHLPSLRGGQIYRLQSHPTSVIMPSPNAPSDRSLAIQVTTDMTSPPSPGTGHSSLGIRHSSFTKAPHPGPTNGVPKAPERLEPNAAPPPPPNSKPHNDLPPAPEAESPPRCLTSKRKKSFCRVRHLAKVRRNDKVRRYAVGRTCNRPQMIHLISG